MFLVPSASATTELEGVVEQVKELIVKHGGQVESMALWDERRLAYEIANHKRAGYLLGFFRMDGGGLDEFRRDLNYSEVVIRHLILARNQDHFEESIAAQKAAAEAAAQPRGEESPEAPAGSDSESAESDTDSAQEESPAAAEQSEVVATAAESEGKAATEEASPASTS
jgi:ribosomal protein S6